MAKEKGRICAPIPGKTRELLLRMVPPGLASVHLTGVTHAYKVDRNVVFPIGKAKIRVTGVHRTDAHEALVCTVNGETHRPDGKLYHITLSTTDGTPPARAGEIDETAIEVINPIEFESRFGFERLWVSRPQLRHQESRAKAARDSGAVSLAA